MTQRADDGCYSAAAQAVYGLDNPSDGVHESADQAPEEITIEEEDVSEEAIRPRIMPDPGQPTLRQLEQHRVTHTPFRS